MNIYIQTWQATVNAIIVAKTHIYMASQEKYEESNDLKELASKQLKLLDDTKPIKDKSLYSQSNEDQKAFIDYLELVILYGNIEGKDKRDL